MLCATLTASVFAQDAAPTVKPPQVTMNKFMRGVYWPWERTAWPAQNAGMDVWKFADKVLSNLKKQSHIDVIWVVNIGNKDAVHLANLAEKYNIGVLPVATAMYDYRGVRTADAAQKMAKSTVAALGGTKGIAGYVLLDEPRRGEVNQLEEIRAALHRLDPARPTFIVSMPRQTEAVAKETQLPILTTDSYPFFGDKSPNGPNNPADSRDYFILASEGTERFARQTGKKSWMMPMIFSDVWGDWHYDKNMNVVAEPGAYLHWRMPTLGETKWQIWQSIFAGAKGAVFYVLFPTPNPRRSAQDAKDMKGYRVAKPAPDWPHFTQETALNYGTGLLYNDGSPTLQTKAMGEVFAAIAPQRELLGRLQAAPQIAFADAPFRATTFVDPATNHTIIVVINDNTDNTVTGKVRLLPNVASARELIAGSSITSQSEQGLSTFSVKIGAGEGTLLDLGKVDAALTYSEDFSIQLSAGKLEDVQKVLSPRDWGLGNRVDVQTQPDSKSPGQLQYKIADVAGNWKRMGGRLFLVYNGSGRANAKSIEVATSSDGETFTPLSTDEFNQPIAIPQGTSDLLFTLLDKDALLSGWQLISVP
jgi:hypothetical protein